MYSWKPIDKADGDNAQLKESAERKARTSEGESSNQLFEKFDAGGTMNNNGD